MLQDVIRQNEELVAALAAALAAGEVEAAAVLLERREAALARLGAALAGTGPGDRRAWQPRLEALAAADRDLLAVAGTALARAGEAFRAQVGSGARGPATDSPPQNACLDRRA